MSNEQNTMRPPPETITISEVSFMHQILQACAQRGAFKPEEFKDVGSLNEKLKALIDFAKSLEDGSNEDEKNDESEEKTLEKPVEKTE